MDDYTALGPPAVRRRAFLRSIPWVTYVEKRRPCDALKWSRMPLKAIYDHGPRDARRPPTGVEPYRCRNVAHWRFVALRGCDAGITGNYCMTHLYSQLRDTTREDRRYREWYASRPGG